MSEPLDAGAHDAGAHDAVDVVDAGPLLPSCEFAEDIPRDAQGCLPLGALAAAKDCRISESVCFSLYSASQSMTKPEVHAKSHTKSHTKENLVAKTPVAVPGVHAAPASPLVTVEQEEAAQEEATQEDDVEQTAEEAVERIKPLPGPPRAPVAHVSEAPVPATAVSELQALLPKDGSGGSGITVLLALIAVAGGGAGWKFYQSFAKQKHEQRMKELELKEKKIELQAERADDKNDHKACEAARASDRAAWESKVAALEERLAEAEKKASESAASSPAQAPELDFDPEDLQDRISQIEAALKKAPNKPSDKKKPKKAKEEKAKADG